MTGYDPKCSECGNKIETEDPHSPRKAWGLVPSLPMCKKCIGDAEFALLLKSHGRVS